MMATRFTFRFETLLKIRSQRESLAKRAVASRLRQIAELQRRHDRLAAQISEQTDRVRGSLGGATLDVDELMMARHWLVRLRQGVLMADAEIAAQRAILAQERAALAEARKQSRILENLKDRQYSTFTAQLQRHEQLELDEMSVTRFAHAQLCEERENP